MKHNFTSKLFAIVGMGEGFITLLMEWAEAWEITNLTYHILMACFFLLASLTFRDKTT